MEEIFSIYNIITILMAYLLGSIPSSVWVGKWFFGVDVREHGSKNAGATNTFRTLGKKAGIPVLFFDIFKGWAAVKFFTFMSGLEPFTNEYVNYQLAVGMAAVFGHIFPIYVGFKGGKGVATLLGIILAIHLKAALVCMAVFMGVFLTFHYVSLAAMTAAFLFPFLVTVVYQTESPSLIYFSVIISSLVLFTHQKNIERLVRNEENKMYIRLKPKGSSDED